MSKRQSESPTSSVAKKLQRFRERSGQPSPTSRPGSEGGRNVGRAVSEWFEVASRAEKTVMLGGLAAVLTGVVVGVFIAFGGGSGDNQAPALLNSAIDSTAIMHDGDAITAQPTSRPVSEVASSGISGPPTPTAAANRSDCDAIRGTSYRSDTERDWYVGNCIQAEVPLAGPVVLAPTDPAAQQPTEAPTELPSGLTASDAISTAVRLLGDQALGSSCTASELDLIWLVTCQIGGNGSTSVCLTSTGALVPDSEC